MLLSPEAILTIASYWVYFTSAVAVGVYVALRMANGRSKKKAR